jgi:hypothetical protein
MVRRLRRPTTLELKVIGDLVEAYEFWMRDANAAPPPPRGEWAVLSAKAIAEHALDEHWNMIERFISQ